MKSMMGRILFISFFLITTAVVGQAPEWTKFENRNQNFPTDSYLIGFSSELIPADQTQEKLLERLSGYAKNQLVESIITEIKAVSTLSMNNVNGNSQEEFKLMSSSSSHASIAGITVKTYIDSKKKASGYAFAYALKSDVIQYYENEIQGFFENTESQIKLIANNQNSGKNEQALKALYKIQTSFREVEHAQAIVTTLTGNFNLPSLKRAEILIIKKDVQLNINGILTNDQFTLEDAAWYITRAIALQIDKKSDPISVSNFTYENSPMGSPFSRRFKASIEQKLITEGFTVSTKVDDTNDLVLYGTYWEENNRLKVITVLRSQQTSQALASSECFIPIMDLTQKNIAFKPENYKNALIAEQQFASKEVTGGDLNIEIWTGKGTNNLIYVGDELLKLFVRANKECYIRLIYYLADGSKVLLLDNYYIDMAKVNMVYELPYTFQCAEPFGIETLQMSAQNKPFELLKFTSEYGYDFLTDDMATILAKTRGFKRLSTEEEEVIKAEKRLVFTTISK